MTKPARGTKRVCKSCGARFYDLNRKEITCPVCGASVEVAAPKPVSAPVPPPKPAAPEPAAKTAPPIVKEEVADEPELISLEEAAAEDGSDVEIDDDVVDIDDEADDLPDTEDDDTFLETEDEEDSDVTGLLGGPIKPAD